MKKLAIITCLMVSAGVFAQEKPKNIQEETTTKTITVDNGREVTQKKVKVTTKEEQELKLAESDKNKVNQQLVASPTKVTQSVQVDDDSDIFYDAQVESASYKCEGTAYDFEKCDTGFTIASSDSDQDYGSAIKSSQKNRYFIKSDDYSGIGYFNNNGTFTVEYYDNNQGKLVKREFVSVD